MVLLLVVGKQVFIPKMFESLTFLFFFLVAPHPPQPPLHHPSIHPSISVHLLRQRKTNASQDWLRKLPQMAKRLEESLFRSATSFEEYNDASTLKQRLQQLAHNIGMKAKKIRDHVATAAASAQIDHHPQQPQHPSPLQEEQLPPLFGSSRS